MINYSLDFYKETTDIVSDVKHIVNETRNQAYKAVDTSLVIRNWLLGKRIYDEELSDNRGDDYGLEIIKKLSKELTNEYGKGFSKSNLYSFYSFYKMYPNIFQTVSGKSTSLLSWSHYILLSNIFDDQERTWYENESLNQSWSYRTLKRNIETQYYHRLLSSGDKKPVIEEMNTLTKDYQNDKLEFVKNPVIFEFLGIPQNASLLEKDLESAIITNIQNVLLELGKGYAFIGRQYHIKTEKEDYYIDLVFYNFILKCFVLIDLKTNKITHQDVGQMDMYVRMFDELKKDANDNPTLGIVLCSENDEDIARYSILKGNEQLFATKYKLYLPSEEELKAEIQHQKDIFKLQNDK